MRFSISYASAPSAFGELRPRTGSREATDGPGGSGYVDRPPASPPGGGWASPSTAQASRMRGRRHAAANHFQHVPASTAQSLLPAKGPAARDPPISALRERRPRVFSTVHNAKFCGGRGGRWMPECCVHAMTRCSRSGRSVAGTWEWRRAWWLDRRGIHSLNQVTPASADWRTSSRAVWILLAFRPAATMSKGPGLARWALMKRRIAIPCCGSRGSSLSLALPGSAARYRQAPSQRADPPEDVPNVVDSVDVTGGHSDE
jgi:hypothetical protein